MAHLQHELAHLQARNEQLKKRHVSLQAAIDISALQLHAQLQRAAVWPQPDSCAAKPPLQHMPLVQVQCTLTTSRTRSPHKHHHQTQCVHACGVAAKAMHVAVRASYSSSSMPDSNANSSSMPSVANDLPQCQEHALQALQAYMHAIKEASQHDACLRRRVLVHGPAQVVDESMREAQDLPGNSMRQAQDLPHNSMLPASAAGLLDTIAAALVRFFSIGFYYFGGGPTCRG